MGISKKKILIMVAAVAIFLLAAQVTMSNAGSAVFKLEGAWIAKVVSVYGQSGEYPFQWSYVLSPSPSGNSASLHGGIDVGFPDDTEIEIDSTTPIIGEIVKTGSHTAVFNSYWYGINRIYGIVEIGRSWGEIEFVEPGRTEVTHHFEIYLPDADGDGDGLPDPGSEPIITFTATTHDRRIPSPVE
jgi:hypothetical protein